jgi:hypothetical protein
MTNAKKIWKYTKSMASGAVICGVISLAASYIAMKLLFLAIRAAFPSTTSFFDLNEKYFEMTLTPTGTIIGASTGAIIGAKKTYDATRPRSNYWAIRASTERRLEEGQRKISHPDNELDEINNSFKGNVNDEITPNNNQQIL